MGRLKLKSSSLLEIIIAMIVLSIMFGSAIMFFARMIHRGTTELELEHHNELRQISSQLRKGNEVFLDSTWSYEFQDWASSDSGLKRLIVKKRHNEQDIEIQWLCIIQN